MFRTLSSCLLVCLSFAGGLTLRADSSDTIDPSCAVPSRFNVVWAAREELAQRLRLDRKRSLAPMSPSPAEIGLAWDAQRHLPRLQLRGQPGRAMQVDSASVLSSTGWQSLLTVNLAQPGLEWLDSTAV